MQWVWGLSLAVAVGVVVRLCGKAVALRGMGQALAVFEKHVAVRLMGVRGTAAAEAGERARE